MNRFIVDVRRLFEDPESREERPGTGRRGWGTLALGLALALVVAGAGCAYFNTLYNANQKFDEAQKTASERDGKPSRQQIDLYDQVIEKCNKVLTDWPNSRHVDDAMLLMARSYFGQQEFEKCVGTLDTLQIRVPKTNLMPAVLALEGRAYAEAGKHDKAVETLKQYLQRFPKGSERPKVLYDLTTSLMTLDHSVEAVSYLKILERDFSNAQETFDAEVSIAQILADKGQYDDSRDIYVRLTSQRIPVTFRYRLWMGLASVDLQLKQYAEALSTLDQVRTLTLDTDQRPQMLLLRAKAFTGVDSTDSAVKTYRVVTRHYSHGEFAAEAFYRLGHIFEGMDSLEAAKNNYEAVARAYSNSEFAEDAIKRSNNIGRLLKLEEAQSENSPEAKALRAFAMGELQLFQMEDPKKALASYQEVLDDYPDADLAPKAAYAVGYIYGVVLGDTTNARRMVDLLRQRYPKSQQAAYADQFMTAGTKAPPALLAPADSLPGLVEPPKKKDAGGGRP